MEKNIKPGSFREDKDDPEQIRKLWLEHEERLQEYQRKLMSGEIKPSYSTSLIKEYEFFRKNIHNPKRVFYPCCNADASPIKAFPDSEVVLMDIDKDTEIIMKNAGISQFVPGDVLKHKPKTPYDLVIILNPAQSSKDLVRHLSNGGYVLANNWHQNVSQLLEERAFRGLGTIIKDESGEPYLAQGDFSKFKRSCDYFGVFQKLNFWRSLLR